MSSSPLNEPPAQPTEPAPAPPMMPVLKPVLKGETTPPRPQSPPIIAATTAAQPALDPERRAAEAIALVQSETFRREVRRQDEEMAGDLKHLIRKPFVMRTVIGILVLTAFAMLRYYRVQRIWSRGTPTQEASAPERPLPVPVAPLSAAPAQPRYIAQPAPLYDPRFDQRLQGNQNYPTPNYAPGMPRAAYGSGPRVPDPYGHLRGTGIRVRPNGYAPGTANQEIVDEILRRQEDRNRRRQEDAQQGGFPEQMPAPQRQEYAPQGREYAPQGQSEAPRQPTYPQEPPPAYPQNQPAQPPQQQPQPAYPPQQQPVPPVPPQPEPYNPPPASGENGGFPPR